MQVISPLNAAKPIFKSTLSQEKGKQLKKNVSGIIITLLILSMMTLTYKGTLGEPEARTAISLVVVESVCISNDSLSDRTPWIMRDANGKFFAFFATYDPEENAHYLRASFSDDGRVWGDPVRLPGSCWKGYPSAIQDMSGVYWLSWEDCGSRDGIRIAHSTNGVDWSSPINVTSGEDFRPSLIQDLNGTFRVAYEYCPSGAEDIQIRSSPDGISWGPYIQVTPAEDECSDIEPCLIQDSNGTYWIAWVRLEPVHFEGPRIWISSSHDGVVWSEPTKIDTGMESYLPSLIQDSTGKFVLAWTDSGSPADANIWVSRSNDCINWEQPQKLSRKQGNLFPKLMRGTDDTYYVTYLVQNEDGMDDVWMDVFAWTIPPVPRFSYFPDVVTIDEEVTFDASLSFDYDGKIVNYQWNFGDGGVAEGEIVTHSYSSAASHTVALTVTDNHGASRVTHQTVDIYFAIKGTLVIFGVNSKELVGQGYAVNTSLSIGNKGSLTEVFSLTFYANTSLIGKFCNVRQPSGSFSTITLIWNTDGLSVGNYHVEVYLSLSPNGTESTDDTLVASTEICITIPGDVDADYDVDLHDAVKLLLHYGAESPEASYDANLDIDNDGKISLFDAVILCKYYGQKYP